MHEKKASIQPVRPLVQPDNDRRKVLRLDAGLADTIDEEIYVTRTRISALNSVINQILSERDLKTMVKQLNWGIYTAAAVGREEVKRLKITYVNIAKPDTMLELIEQRFDALNHLLTLYDEDLGMYRCCGLLEGRDWIGGLTSTSRGYAVVSTFAALGISVLNDKLAVQHRLLNQEEAAKREKRQPFQGFERK